MEVVIVEGLGKCIKQVFKAGDAFSVTSDFNLQGSESLLCYKSIYNNSLFFDLITDMEGNKLYPYIV